MNYQGRISLTYGAQVTDGPYNPVFNIYHVASGGTADWTETDAVNTKNGLFSVVLGQTSPLSGLPGDQPYWLEVVWAGQSMSPRQPLTSAPYALWAGSVDLPLSGTTSSSSAAVAVTNTSGPGVVGVGNNGVVGKGSLIGAKGEAMANNATGLYGDYGGFSNAYALKVSGPAQFWGGPVSFTGSVDFTGAAVTGLSGGGVTVPLTLSGAVALPGTVLSATNTGTGNAGAFYSTGGGSAIYAQGSPNAISATVNGTGTAIYARTSGGSFLPAVLAQTGGSSAAVEGMNTGFNVLGMLGGNPQNGTSGVFGQALNSGLHGVDGQAYQGVGVMGQGQVGVEGQVTLTGQTAMLADYGGLANAYAMKVSGPAQFWGGPVSFTSTVDFTNATVLGLGASQSVTASVAWPAGVFNANNIGTGYGVFGRSTAPGAADAQGNPLTINAGVYGYANVSLAAGVYGYSAYALSNAAGVVAIGPTGIFGIGNNANGQGGSFQANSGTAVNAQGLNGVQIRSGSGGKGLDIQAPSPTDTALQIDNGTSNIDGTMLVMANAVPGTAVLRVQQSQVNFGGEAIYGSTGASATAAVMGESFDTTAPNAQGTASAGVFGRGASGVTGVSNNPAGFGLLGSVDATGLAGSAGVFASNVGLGYGVNAQGVTGTVSRPNVPGGLGLLASDNNLGGSTLALMAQGASVFNGPVQFNGAVSGLNLAVTAPLTLSAATALPVLGGANSGNGPGVAGTAVVSNAAGVSGTNDVAGGDGAYGGSANGVGVYGASSSGIGVEGAGDWGVVAFGQSAGVSATNTTANGWGVWTSAQATGGKGVVAFGDSVGVASTATNPGGTGVIAYGGGMGLSATAATGDAIYARTGASVGAAVVGRTDSGSSFGLQGIGYSTGTGVEGSVASGSSGSRAVQGINAAVGGIGVEGTNTDSVTGGGIGVNGLASHSNSFGVMASNPSTLATYTNGAAIYVSGSVKTSRTVFTDNANYGGGIWNVNGASALVGGPELVVRLGTGFSASSCSEIFVYDTLINANSVAVVSFYGVLVSNYTTEVNSSGGLYIYTNSTTFPAGSGFNVLIIN